jgi:diguanylate cyclase (GGDEF)-like protein
MRNDPRAARDLALAVATVILVTAFALTTRIVDRVTDWTSSFSAMNKNGIVALLLAVPVATTVFSYRRYRDASAARHELTQLSMLDSLTGLPNRRSLPMWFARGMARAGESNSRLAVLFVDLDRFKIVNDTYGHDVGDQLIAEIAARLRNALRPGDRVVRYGGDEFVVLCHDVATEPVAKRLAERIVEIVEAPVEVSGQRVEVSASVGIAIVPAKSGSMDDVLSAADAAMYEAKSRGTGQCVVVEAGEDPRSQRTRTDRALRIALEHGQFVLHYQPVVSVADGSLAGAEALIRWQHPERGLLLPGAFLRDLEDGGLIVPVGNWIIDTVFDQARAWQDAFPALPFRVTCNVSAIQLAQADFGAAISRALQTSGVRPERVCFEITEGALLLDVSRAWATLRQAKDRGIQLALDDFGTGYSSLSYLRRFNLDMLKIDRSFTEGLGATKEDTAIVEHVIGLAHALGLVVVAEGVEFEAQYRELRRLHCDYAQGFYFSKGQPPEVITRLLRLSSQRPDDLRVHDLILTTTEQANPT